MSPHSLQDVYAAGLRAFDEGRLVEAGQLLEIVAAHVPEVAAVFAILAKLRTEQKEWERAISAARHAIAVSGPADPVRFIASHDYLLAAAHAAGGTGRVAREYAGLRDSFHKVFDMPLGKFLSDAVESGLRCAIYADDRALAERLMGLRFPNAAGIGGRMAISPYVALKTWCETNRASFHELTPTRRLTVGAGEASRTYDAPGFSYGIIPRGEVVAGLDLAIAPTGEVIADSGYMSLEHTFNRWMPYLAFAPVHKVIHLWPNDVQDIAADVLFLSGPEYMHVGHWIVDFLPRLRCRKVEALREYKVGVPSSLIRKNRDLLAQFGVTSEDMIVCEHGQRYRFRNLAVARPGNHRYPAPENLAFLIGAMRAPPTEAPPQSRIFLVRSTPTRQITNMAEVDPVLDRFGFERMDLAQAPVAEQRQRLGAARIVIGTYGSDPLALLNMPLGSDLVELTYDLTFDAGTAAMCALTGIGFHRLLCPAGQRSEQAQVKKDRDFAVESGRLEALLGTLLGAAG